MYDAMLEEFRDSDVITSVVEELSKEIAMDTLKYYGDKHRKQQEKEVMLKYYSDARFPAVVGVLLILVLLSFIFVAVVSK